MTYDLLIRGAHLLDPGQGIDGRFDVGISGGRIVALAPVLETVAMRVVDARGLARYVLPGLINLHTHVAHGATTSGVGLVFGDADLSGVASGVTTEVDAGSTGVANFGLFPVHVLPRAATRVICYLNVGSHAFAFADRPDVGSLEDIDSEAIARCIERNPGLVKGFKLRLEGPLMAERGEDVIRLAKAVARDHGLPLMVHIGDQSVDSQKAQVLTRFLLKNLERGDVLTHYCTGRPGGVMDSRLNPLPELEEARSAGVVMDACTGRIHFSPDVARRQAELGLHPMTLSTDLAARGHTMLSSLTHVMGRYMALGYGLSDVVRMTTSGPAGALQQRETLGAIAVGREADLTIVDLVRGRWDFGTQTEVVTGELALVPVQTLRGGVPVAPDWGPNPWGWLPREVGH